MNSLKARQNALLGAMIGLGQLQALSGPDQRITAPASQWDSDASTSEIKGVAQPHWIGVWNSDPGIDWMNNRYNTSDSYYDYDARRDGSSGFMGWLVSGTNTPIEQVGSALDFASESDNSVLVFGYDFDSEDPVQVANRVAVERVLIASEGKQGDDYFAFWISDESMKARVANYSASVSDEDSLAVNRSRFVVNQRFGLENLSKDPHPFSSFDGFDASLDTVISKYSIKFLDSGLGMSEINSFLNRYAHTLTLHSRSLLTNLVNGGLQYDLSTILRNANPLSWAPFDGLPAFRDGDVYRILPAIINSGDHPVPSAASWQQLVDFFQQSFSEDQIPLIRKHTDFHVGRTPLITRYRLKVIPLFERSIDPSKKGDDFYLCLAPVVVLHNPYDHPLLIPSDSLRVVFLLEERNVAAGRGIALTGHFVKAYEDGLLLSEVFLPSPSSSPASPWDLTNVPNLLDNSLLTTFTDSAGVSYRGFSFLLPSYVMDAGEVVSFGIALDGDDYNGNNLLEAGGFDINPSMVRLLNRDTDGNILRASLTWSLPNPNADLRHEQGALHINGDGDVHKAERLNPFLTAVGLSNSGGKVLNQSDFYYLVEAIEGSNPNLNVRYESPISHGRNQVPVVVGGLASYSGMSSRAVYFDVVLGPGAGHFDANDRTTPSLMTNGYRYGFLINDRWMPLQSGKTFVQRPTAQDSALFPNSLYGAVASYAPFARSGMWNMHDPKISLLDHNAFWGTGLDFETGQHQIVTMGSHRQKPGLLSIGQLRNFPLSNEALSAEATFGGGIAPRRIGHPSQLVNSIAHADARQHSPITVDFSYIFNDHLHDSFFFSGLTFDIISSDITVGESVSLNELLTFSPQANTNVANEPETAAAAFAILGGFNINSTDINAWKSLLSGANLLNLNHESGASSGSLKNPFTRVTVPKAGSGSSLEERVNGFRELSMNELQALAEAIVSIIKQRGPYFSVADFVNRRLVGAAARPEEGWFGSLEAAIRKSGINAPLLTNGGLFTEADFPTGYVLPAGMIEPLVIGPRWEGLSQWLNQTDILERIAPRITARGDTYIIHGYGSSSGIVVRCELIVQRSYEYVNPVNSPSSKRYRFDNNTELFIDDYAALAAENNQFGRRYNIIEFRWK